MKIVIAGAGIAGIVAAISFRKFGHEVAVYERASELKEVGAGISLWPNALRALQQVDAYDVVSQLGLPANVFEFRARSGRSNAVQFDSAGLERKLRFSPWLQILHRAELLDGLVGLLPKDIVHLGHELSQIEQSPENVTARFANGHEVTGDLLIGADGLRSAVRRVLPVNIEPRYSGYTCWRGVCPRPASIPIGHFSECWGRGARFGIATMTRDRVYWWATKSATLSQTVDESLTSPVATFKDFAPPIPELIASTPANSILHNPIFDLPPHQPWWNRRVILIGDAAHATTPNLGQGGCQAIVDAVVLGKLFRDFPSQFSSFDACCLEIEKRFRAYEKIRRPQTTGVINASRRFGWLGQWESPLGCAIRDSFVVASMKMMGTAGLPPFAADNPFQSL